MITLTKAETIAKNLLPTIGRNNWKTSGLLKYLTIMNMRYKSTFDPRKDVAFQELFKDFYGMTKAYATPSFITPYFQIMYEVLHNTDYENFKWVLSEIKSKCRKIGSLTGTFEISYASKLLHTVNPEKYPIWDSKLVPGKASIASDSPKHFSDPIYGGCAMPVLRTPESCCDAYEHYFESFNEYLKSSAGQELISVFDKYITNVGITGISNIKKIDFILWLDR